MNVEGTRPKDAHGLERHIVRLRRDLLCLAVAELDRSSQDV